MEDKWRKKAADTEKWKTSEGRKLPIGRSGRQVEGEGCRYGEVEDKWREKTADREKWKTGGGRRLPIGRSGRQVEGESCR